MLRRGYSFSDTRDWVHTVSRVVGRTLPDSSSAPSDSSDHGSSGDALSPPPRVSNPPLRSAFGGNR